MKQSHSAYAHYLPRLEREFYQADAVIFWTLPISNRATGWLNDSFHAVFREITLHVAAREGLLCPVYCLMPDHLHFVWMGLRKECDQRNGMKFFRAHMGKRLKPFKFQHQAHDHVLSAEERRRDAFAKTCNYAVMNPVKAGLAGKVADWKYLGAVIPGYPDISSCDADYWPWFWKQYVKMREQGIEQRKLPPRQVE